MSSVADKDIRALAAAGSPTDGAAASGGQAAPSPRRHYDAHASRRALLDAAVALFYERGYEPTTVREIGERAGVDAALIARYFGSKEGLYLATLQEQGIQASMPADPAGALEHMLSRSELRGSGPVGHALVSPTLTDAMREQVSEIVGRHVVEPLAAELAARGVSDAELRAELLVAISSGVSLTRASGALPALATASLEDVLAVLAPLVDALQARA